MTTRSTLGPMTQAMELRWEKFTKLTDARSRFARTPCVYVQTDARGCPIRVGKASEGLEARYRGGTGYALDAAMHCSRNLIFVAPVKKNLCGLVEGKLIWQGRRCLTYNNLGKIVPPTRRMLLAHLGQPPIWNGFDADVR